MAAGTGNHPDPRKLVEQELARATSPLLTHDQESRYKAELKKPAARRKAGRHR